MKKIQQYVITIISIIALIIIDQYTKYLATLHLKGQNPIPIWKNIFELHYVENRGAAFGILQNQKPLFIVLTCIVLIGIVYIYLKIPNEAKYKYMHLLLILLVAGALGNFIDRLFNGFVVDFFYFKLIDFPVFNVADIYVSTFSVAAIILSIFYYKEDDWNFLNKK